MSGHLFSFYQPSLEGGADTVEITGEEQRHLRRVLRLRAGEAVRVTNGRGLLVHGEIETVGGSTTTVRVTGIESEGAPSRRLVLALALLQRAHFDAAVSQCVEVGVTEIVPVVAERCHVRAWTPALAARAARVAIAAMKQSGRAWLARVHDAVDVAGLAALVPGFERAVLAEADAAPWSGRTGGGDTLAIVGAEGGFSAEEVRRLTAAGAETASISSHRLRSETAAVVLVSLLAHLGGDPRAAPTRASN